jgi:hypothetical protein
MMLLGSLQNRPAGRENIERTAAIPRFIKAA